jgi:aquaporin related protein
MGALLASAFYKLIKYLNYEEVNGDQDKSLDEEQILDMAKSHQQRVHKSIPHRSGPRVSQHSNTSQIPSGIGGAGSVRPIEGGNAPPSQYQPYRSSQDQGYDVLQEPVQNGVQQAYMTTTVDM